MLQFKAFPNKKLVFWNQFSLDFQNELKINPRLHLRLKSHEYRKVSYSVRGAQNCRAAYSYTPTCSNEQYMLLLSFFCCRIKCIKFTEFGIPPKFGIVYTVHIGVVISNLCQNFLRNREALFQQIWLNATVLYLVSRKLSERPRKRYV